MKSRLFGILTVLSVLFLQTACSSTCEKGDRATASQEEVKDLLPRGADSRKVL